MKFSRRCFLQSAGLGAAAAPLVPREVWGQTGAAPKRFIAFFSSNGTLIPGDTYASTGTGTNYQLGYMLDPLQPFKDRVLVLRGIDQAVGAADPGSAHGRGIGAFLTGRRLNGSWADGISLDQHIANRVGTTSKFRSLELGVAVNLRANARGSASFEDRMSYSGPGSPVAPEDDPLAVFKRVFSSLPGLGGNPGMVDVTFKRRKGVLDFVNRELSALSPRLGAEQRQKLDSHLSSLRQIEQQLQAPPPPEAGCVLPPQPNSLAPYATNSFPVVGKLQMDMLVAAMACDLTRVGSIMFSSSISDQTFPFAGIQNGSRGHHLLSHDPSNAYADLAKIKRWHAEQFLYLLQKMDAVKEGNGSMLDNSVVLWGSEIGLGDHSMKDMRFVLAGRAGGALQTGRRLVITGRHHNDLLISVLQAMGIQENTFGDPAYATGALTQIL